MSSEDAIVYVVDDDADLAASLSRMFRRNGWRAEAFVDPDAFIAGYKASGPTCIVTDIHMGATDGFAMADTLRAIDPGVGFVFMTAWPETRHAVEAAQRRGGIDYLDKPLDETRLILSVENAVDWSAKQRAAEARLSALSRRERQVFDLLASGFTNKAMAAKLGLSEKTVEDHRARLMAKTGMRSLAEIIAAARAVE